LDFGELHRVAAARIDQLDETVKRKDRDAVGARL
jgi:hypothetical protein